jgi:hypothetical protein
MAGGTLVIKGFGKAVRRIEDVNLYRMELCGIVTTLTLILMINKDHGTPPQDISMFAITSQLSNPDGNNKLLAYHAKNPHKPTSQWLPTRRCYLSNNFQSLHHTHETIY